MKEAFWVKTHLKGPKRALDVRFYDKKLEFFFWGHFKPW
jgi:hypothetical protein